MKKFQDRKLSLVAHRGCRSLYPENTLPGFRKAIELGVHAIEFDVHRTADDHLVVTHDHTLERCSNGTGKVCDHTLAELKALDFGSWKDEKFKGTQIPILSEVLDLLVTESDPALQILIELKANDNLCTEMVLAEIRKRNITQRTVVLSFYANQLAYLHTLAPELRLQGFMKDQYTVSVPEIYDLTMRVCLFGDRLTREEISFFHSINIEVDHCPVNTEEALDKILEYDVDTITSDAPDIIMPLLEARGFSRIPV